VHRVNWSQLRLLSTNPSEFENAEGGNLGRNLENKILSYVPAFVADFLLDLAFGRQKFNADESAMYLYKSTLYMSWPYDDYGRLVGENIWEPEPHKAEIIKLAPADVLTTQEANRLLAPFIKPPPSLGEMVADVNAARA
jgi:hypothetical protein